jgi:hypothetical protein
MFFLYCLIFFNGEETPAEAPKNNLALPCLNQIYRATNIDTVLQNYTIIII